jgi:hypothetical protein
MKTIIQESFGYVSGPGTSFFLAAGRKNEFMLAGTIIW